MDRVELYDVFCPCVLPVPHQLSWSASVCTLPPKPLINRLYLCSWQQSYQSNVRLKHSIPWINGIPKECKNTSCGSYQMSCGCFPSQNNCSCSTLSKTISLFRSSGNKKFPNQWWRYLHSLCLFPITQLQWAVNSSICITMQREHWSSWFIKPMTYPKSCLRALSDPWFLLSPLLFPHLC